MVPVARSAYRLKMAVLYFLSSIFIVQAKTGNEASPVEPLFLRAVDDFEFCKDFPWRIFSVDHMLEEIEHTMSHFKGTVKEGALWPIPGFYIPMELLAFEIIPELGKQFLEEYPEADKNCPRMCRKRFKKVNVKGFLFKKYIKHLVQRWTLIVS